MLFFSTLLSRYPLVTDDGLHFSYRSGFSPSLRLTATLSTRHPHCYANHGEHCSGNITKDLSAPFSSSSPGSCFTGNAQGVMRHVPLFKGCFGYIRDFPFSFFFICCIFICLSVWVELHLLQFGLVPLREAAELTVIHCTTQTYNFNVISRIPDLFWSQR